MSVIFLSLSRWSVFLWRAVISTRRVPSVWAPEILTAAGVSCSTCEYTADWIEHHQSLIPSIVECTFQKQPCGLNDAFLRRRATKDYVCRNRKHMAYELQILVLSFPHHRINLCLTGRLASDWIGGGLGSTGSVVLVREIAFEKVSLSFFFFFFAWWFERETKQVLHSYQFFSKGNE